MSDFMKTYPIRKIYEHGPGVKSFYFDKIFEVKAGEFVNVWSPGVDEKPYSVSAVIDDMIEVSVKAYGPFSKDLMTKKVGDRLGVRGPFGHGFTLHDNALLIGGGIGIAPLRILAQELTATGYRFVNLLGAAVDYEIIFASDFEKTGRTYFTTDDLAEIIEKEKIEFIYTAGPEIMYVKVREIIDSMDSPYEFCME
ncbi:MAG: hypothetical protein P8X42_10870, partial [Calditrichaceae bacterium]